MPDPTPLRYDVLVIGAGGAGLRAALAAAEEGARVAVVSKSLLGKSQTVMGAALAVVLAAVGLYSVMAYVVTQSTHDIGIRMTLGAHQRDVLSLVLIQGTKLISVGVVVGIGSALGLTQLMSGLLFGVTATDPVTLSAVAALLIIVALAACYIPARRAMRMDPLVALRYE